MPADERLIAERDRVVELIRQELRALVREHGSTQRSLEEANGFTPGYLSQVLQGHITLTVRHFYGLLLALDISPAELFRRVLGPELGEPGYDEIRERLARHEAVIAQLERQGLVKPPDETPP